MEKILIQGEAYIKKAPHILTQDEADKLNYDFHYFSEELSKHSKTDSIANKKVEAGEMDYSCMDTFFVLNIEGNKYYLTGVRRYAFLTRTIEVSANDLENNYISLREFLHDAKFIGKKGVRESAIFVDTYCSKDRAPYVLYQGGWCTLIKQKIGDRNYEFEMLPPLYTINATWHYFGDVEKQYQNPATLYKEIYNQLLHRITEQNKGKKRKR